jgi:hypothetical protein
VRQYRYHRRQAAIVGKFLPVPALIWCCRFMTCAGKPGALLKLVDYPVDFVSGIYPQRCDPITFALRYIEDMPRFGPTRKPA